MIEIEYKYIIKNVNNFEDILLSELKEQKVLFTSHDIEQHYLKGSGRVRSKNNEIFEFNYKDFLGKNKGNIEFDCQITEQEFKEAIQVSVLNFNKTRITFEQNSFKFEVDLFKKENDLYFILMEVEVSSNNIDPVLTNLPKIILDNIIVKTLDDERFSSKSLSDVNYATQLYDLI